MSASVVRSQSLNFPVSLILSSGKTLLHNGIITFSRKQPLTYSCHYHFELLYQPKSQYCKISQHLNYKNKLQHYTTHIKITSHQVEKTYCVIFMHFQMYKNVTLPALQAPYLLKNPQLIPEYSLINLNYANLSDLIENHKFQIPFLISFQTYFFRLFLGCPMNNFGPLLRGSLANAMYIKFKQKVTRSLVKSLGISARPSAQWGFKWELSHPILTPLFNRSLYSQILKKNKFGQVIQNNRTNIFLHKFMKNIRQRNQLKTSFCFPKKLYMK